jgi:hypothetical protein
MGQGNSKASTVELAIVYIRALQKDLADTKARLEVAEKKLAEGNSSSSQTSDWSMLRCGFAHIQVWQWLHACSGCLPALLTFECYVTELV